MNEYGNGCDKSKTSQTSEDRNGLDRLSLQAEQKIIFVDTKTLEIANILRGSEGYSKRTADIVRSQLNELILYLGREGNWSISKYGNNICPTKEVL